MYELALFAGAGGGLLATKYLLGWRTVCYVEREPYCVDVLKARIRDGLLDDAPIWDDVRTFDGNPWRGCVDIITAGFPCQPFSVAGKRAGGDDDRNGWPATARIIREVRPRYVLLENVPTLRCAFPDGRPAYFGQVLGDLAESGYDARWDCIPASAIGANHQRDRLWIVATDSRCGEWSGSEACPRGQFLANANGKRLLFAGADGGRSKHANPQPSGHRWTWWKTEPELGRVVDGMAHRVDRIRAIGNGQVPAVVGCIWRLLGCE